ncbi:hypothetical protein [Rhodococcus ruber]|uniref:hypothetical protein n=1 Tax=Rhodococcus ruber TaxID=1830 RepID=UPI003784A51A
MTEHVSPFDEQFSPGHNPIDTAIAAMRASAIADLAERILREWPAYAASNGIVVPDPPRTSGVTALLAQHAATIAADAMLVSASEIVTARSEAEAQVAALEAASNAAAEAEQVHAATPADWGTVHA